MISYEQEIRIKNFIEHFKNKGMVRGKINIAIWGDGHSIDHQTFLDSDMNEAEEIGFIDGQDHLEDVIAAMNGIDLSEYISEEQAEELMEYYKSKKE